MMGNDSDCLQHLRDEAENELVLHLHHHHSQWQLCQDGGVEECQRHSQSFLRLLVQLGRESG